MCHATSHLSMKYIIYHDSYMKLYMFLIFFCVCLLFMVTFHIQACVLWFHDFFPKSTCSILVSGDCSPPFKKLVTLLQAKVWPAILMSFLAGYILYDIIYHDLYMKYNVLNYFFVSLWSLLFRPQIVTKQLSLKISGISHLVNGVS